MSEKPEALRLADAIDPGNDASKNVLTVDVRGAAAELRRLHAECEALRAALKSTGLFLHHCWCNVPMNEHSFDLLSKQMEVVDAAMEQTK